MIAAITGVLIAVVFSLGSLVLRDTFEKHIACFSSQLNPQSC